MSKKSIQYSVDFERFWGIYPPLRKSKKADAYAAWEKVLSDGASPEIILSAVVLFSQSNVGLGKYCPGPLPWINQKRWEDELVLPKVQKPFQLDASGNSYLGYCSRCNVSDFYHKDDLTGDSRCCKVELMPERRKK